MTTRAFGAPGLPPRWTRSAKDAIGTAYHTASRVWFTITDGILSEIYYPTVDDPQTRDLEFLITDGRTFFHEEKRDLRSTLEPLDRQALGWRLTNADPGGRYRLVKEVISDPHVPTVLLRVRLEGDAAFVSGLRLYVLLSPRLDGRGGANDAAKAVVAGRELLTARGGRSHLALGASVPFLKTSCGYVGASDGWTDLRGNFELDWTFDEAPAGHVALTGQLDVKAGETFTLGVGFGFHPHGAATHLLQSLAVPFEEQKARFIEQWDRVLARFKPLEKASGDGGRLCRVSRGVLLAHEDKAYPGALIASLSIPWGEVRGDEDGLGGYHLVWTRDLCQSASALLAAGEPATALRALVYLSVAQLADGGFYQNFWIDGDPYWRGVQLDEAAFPILLAWRLQRLGALREFDPYPMVRKAAGFLLRNGPATPEERWEEASGYSPSTLAAVVAGLLCAADLCRGRGDEAAAAYLERHADFVESHIEDWTVTGAGTLVPGIRRHYIRVSPGEDPDRGTVVIANRGPRPREFPAKDVVDAGFLELVRYGVRPAGSPLMEDSLRVVDALLKVETPLGPCWRRYNHDGYGQKPDGGPFDGWGRGRAWPLLTGERGHYELAAGRDARPYAAALERFASGGGMLPEQVWDSPDLPAAGLYLGRPTGSAMPLAWAHGEYLKLLRSISDGAVFDRVDVVAGRCLEGRGRRDLEFWSFGRRVARAAAGRELRIQAEAPFRLRWSKDGWGEAAETPSNPAPFGLQFVDLRLPGAGGALKFTFYWTQSRRWEGADFTVEAV